MSVKLIRRFSVSLAALVLSSGLALAQSKVTLAVGGGSCLCYLPTMLAQALGEYEKAGVNVEIVDFKGGSESLKAVIGGSADVVDMMRELTGHEPGVAPLIEARGLVDGDKPD